MHAECTGLSFRKKRLLLLDRLYNLCFECGFHLSIGLHLWKGVSGNQILILKWDFCFKLQGDTIGPGVILFYMMMISGRVLFDYSLFDTCSFLVQCKDENPNAFPLSHHIFARFLQYIYRYFNQSTKLNITSVYYYGLRVLPIYLQV